MTQKNKKEYDFEELAHAFQDAMQPPHCEEWGDGYWKAIDFCKDYFEEEIAQTQKEKQKEINRLLKETLERGDDLKGSIKNLIKIYNKLK